MAKTVRKTVAMEAATHDDLVAIAEREGRSVSDVVRRLIEARIAEMKRRAQAQPAT